ncbi:MAG: S-layer homology domain-containing protein [Clostridia bacterium]|nr:S-layer homology domain-containing protein [Clostridia bacterium]
MRATKRIITLIAALALLLSSALPAFAAESYPDLEGHWSKKYMERLVDEGILAGYTDGTIRPERTVTAAEAFVMLANLYDLSAETKDEIYADYGKTIEAATDVTWAYKQLAVCLAAGIFTESELKNLNMSAKMPKQNLAVYMVRAIQRADDAAKLDNAKLDYKDAADITAKCLGSIALLTQMDVVSGDTNGNITPKANVTRAVFATMLCNILDYLEDEDVELRIEDYVGRETMEGILTGVSSNALTVRDFNGLYHRFSRTSSLKATVNGTAKSLNTGNIGSYVKVQSEEGTAVSAAVTESSNVSYRQGRLTDLVATTGSIKISDLADGSSAAFIVTGATIREDGKKIAFTELTRGAFLTLKIEKDTVKEITSTTKEYTISGEISDIDYAGIVTMRVKTDDEESVLYLDLKDMPAIKRGSMAITVDRLSEGQAIKATVKGGEVQTITTEGKDATATGILDAVTRSRTSTTWTIEDEDGKKTVYLLDSSAVAYSGKTSVKIDSINPGDEVSLVVSGGYITEITLSKAYTPSSDKLNAEVLAVNSKERVLTTLVNGKLLYIDCSDAGSLINGVTGKSLSFSAFREGDLIVVYGSYKDASTFEATSVVVEVKN